MWTSMWREQFYSLRNLGWKSLHKCICARSWETTQTPWVDHEGGPSSFWPVWFLWFILKPEIFSPDHWFLSWSSTECRDLQPFHLYFFYHKVVEMMSSRCHEVNMKSESEVTFQNGVPYGQWLWPLLCPLRSWQCWHLHQRLAPFLSFA